MTGMMNPKLLYGKKRTGMRDEVNAEIVKKEKN